VIVNKLGLMVIFLKSLVIYIGFYVLSSGISIKSEYLSFLRRKFKKLWRNSANQLKPIFYF
jgi:hypothetical protein